MLDKSKPLRQAKSEELSDEILTQAIERDVKLWIDNASTEIAKALNMSNVKITMRGSAIQHILNGHVEQSLLAKNGQPPIIFTDLKQHGLYVNNADMHGVKTLLSGEKLLISGKQVNGYYVIVESINTKHNELKLKTLYKENGKLKNAGAFKDIEIIHTAPTSQTPSSKGYDLARNQAEVKSGSADSTTNKIFNQGDIKFDSLEDFTHFAKLSGFENIPQEKLQSAHKYILENLHKLEC